MPDITCFWLEPSDTIRVSLRRYSRLSERCPLSLSSRGPHDASNHIEDKQFVLGEDISGRYEHDDQRWPVECICGYRFRPEDPWQANTQLYYTRSDNHQRMTLRDAPPGAMYDATWMKSLREYGHKDGRCLAVSTPRGEWCIDGPSTDGKRWTRTGEPPKITVQGSILIGEPAYHAVLEDGILKEV